MTVDFNCNSISKKIVLIVSINFEMVSKKKTFGFEIVDDEY